jgi:hypothetical protein
MGTKRMHGLERRVAACGAFWAEVAFLAVLGLLTIAPRQAGAQQTQQGARSAEEPAATKQRTRPSADTAKADQPERDSTSAEAPQDDVPVSDQALSARYRFMEKYAIEEDPAHPGVITTYQVSARGRVKKVVEKPQGAPARDEVFQHVIYTERAAKVDRLGEVREAIRRYDAVQMPALDPARPETPPYFKGLTVWYERRTGQAPLVLSLTENHPLREPEYIGITRQIFMPQLTSLLPQTPARVGDTWKIPLKSVHYLVGENPEEDSDMNATLEKILKAPSGTTLTAIIDLKATLNLPVTGPCTTHAQIQFVFDPPVAPIAPPAEPAVSEKKDEAAARPARAERKPTDIVEARGRISQVLMATQATTALPEGDGRLNQIVTYELELHRRALPPGGKVAPLDLPEPAPIATEGNSWLVHDDPARQFAFRHPQELEVALANAESLELVEHRPEGGADVFVIQFPPGPDDPQGIARFRKTYQFKREIEADWARRKTESVLGPEGWLPEIEWDPLKVYRKELAGKTAGAPVPGKPFPRIYFDYYLVLGKHNDCLWVHSITNRDDHVAFRKVAERMIKSFRFGPATAAGAEPGTAKPASDPGATAPTNAPGNAQSAPPVRPSDPPR